MLSNASFGLLILAYVFLSGSNALPEDDGCIGIRQCPAALKHVQIVRTNEDSLNILRRAHCGFSGMEPVVNCSSIPDLPDTGKREDCIPLQDCPAALRLMQAKVFDPQAVNMFRLAHCGTTKQQPLVNCQKITI